MLCHIRVCSWHENKFESVAVEIIDTDLFEHSHLLTHVFEKQGSLCIRIWSHSLNCSYLFLIFSDSLEFSLSFVLLSFSHLSWYSHSAYTSSTNPIRKLLSSVLTRYHFLYFIRFYSFCLLTVENEAKNRHHPFIYIQIQTQHDRVNTDTRNRHDLRVLSDHGFVYVFVPKFIAIFAIDIYSKAGGVWKTKHSHRFSISRFFWLAWFTS